MKIRNSKDLLDDLVNLNADQWNIKLAKELGLTLEEFKIIFLIRDKITNISEDRIKLDLYKFNIENFGNDQKVADEETYEKLESVEFRSDEDPETLLEKPTTLDKFTIRVNESDMIIESISCTGKIIVGMDFSKAELESSYFCNCIFYNCDFNDANLGDNLFQGCIFNSCSFLKTDFSSSVISKCLFFDGNMDSSCFDVCIFTDTSIIASQLNLSSFIQSTFVNSGLSDCEFSNTSFLDTKFSTCAASHCNFKDSSFKRAKFVDMLLIKTDLRGCDLNHSSMTAITSTGCKYDEKYIDLFKMNHILFSPSVSEWVPKADESDNIDSDRNEGEDDDEQSA